MALKERLRSDLSDAMRSGDTEKRDALRLLMAAIKQDEVDKQKELDDVEVQGIISKQAKQRRESIADYEKAGRQDLVDVESMELAIIESYLPQMMSREEIELIASKTIAKLGINSPKEMGQVMGKLMPQLKGKADGKMVNEVVRDLLQG